MFWWKDLSEMFHQKCTKIKRQVFVPTDALYVTEERLGGSCLKNVSHANTYFCGRFAVNADDAYQRALKD